MASPSSRIIGGLLLWAAALGGAHGALVGFADGDYVILPGETIALQVLIQTSAGEPDDLFSYGMRLVPSTTDSLGVISISVPSALDFFGVSGPGALVDLSTSVIGVKGNIDIFGDPMVPYADSLLATFELRFDALGDYAIGLDFFQTAGANEEIFLAGDGTVFDDAITFGTTTLHVLSEDEIVPEMSLARSGVGNVDMDISFPTIAGLSYTVQTSINLVDWIDLITTEGDGADFFFRHPGGGGLQRNFYRVTATTDAL